jgi:2-oxoglutarate ferredoxin oxidoreductase subunit delta
MEASPVQLDLELCKACGICIELCPDKVFDRDKQGNPVISRPEECSRCLICELHCPDFAIEVRRREKKGKAVSATEGPGADEGAGAAGAPALTREQLVAATRDAAGEDDGCAHDGEEG